MEELRQLLSQLREFDVLLFHLGETEVTVLGLFKFAALLVALFYFTHRVDRWMVERVLAGTELELGMRVTIAAVVRYLLLLLGFLVIIQTSGINLTSLNVFAGAIGVGVGFGLQNIVSNFVSGLIIMFERSIRVGDRIEIGPIEGEVTEIGARRTTILTSDNLHFIVPNTRFITESVANLHYHGEARIGVRVKVTVASGPDPRRVRDLLIEAANENPHVLKSPPPQVLLASYQAGGAMAFELLAWNIDLVGARELLASELNFQIGEKFARHDIKLA